MVFSSTAFLFFFLPLTLALYYLPGARHRNPVLLCASLLFYAWGEPTYVALMMLSILFNWGMGLWIAAKHGQRSEGIVLATGVAINLLVLAHYKYSIFLLSSFNSLIGLPFFHFTVDTHPLPLPVGISFFTFHAISYLVDIRRGQAQALRNPLDMGLYISLFPQLVAGPIIRYHDVADQLVRRTNTLERFASGVERFAFGLGKKILLANTLGEIADQAFAIPVGQLSAATAWTGIVCYTLQIYFDFSGYSDMAIGLARMFGFELTENFNYPYISKSIREFWRRWHLSLSTWFRDYVYIPLGGNRGSALRVRLNLFTVFFLCGLWHGASWNFVVWGIFHGLLLVVERGWFGRLLDRQPALLGHAYALFMVMIGWVFFRADTLTDARHFLVAMFSAGGGIAPQVLALIESRSIATLVLALIVCTPVLTFMARDWHHRRFPDHANEPLPAWAMRWRPATDHMTIVSIRGVSAISILMLSIAAMATSTYNPFIYFRF